MGPLGLTPAAPAAELTASAVLAAAVLLAVLRWGVPEPRWAMDWLGLEPAARWAVVAPTLRLAEALARFDDRVIDGAVDATGRGTRTAAAVLARADSRRVDGAVECVSALTGRLGKWARRPQTGQLHQYYMAAVVVVLVAVLLLIVVR